MSNKQPYSDIVKAIVSAPGRAFVAGRPYWVYLDHPEREHKTEFVGRFSTAQRAAEVALQWGGRVVKK